MKDKQNKEKQELDINIFFNDNGDNIIEILETDFANFVNNYLKLKILKYWDRNWKFET